MTTQPVMPDDSIPTTIKLTGRLLNFTRLLIQGNQLPDILAKIAEKLGQQRQSRLPVVVSCQDTLNLAQLWQGLWELGLQPIGLVTGILDEQAAALNIAIFPADGQRIDGKAPAIPTHDKAAAEHHLDNKQNTSHTENTAITTANNKLNIHQHHTSQLVGDLVHQQILRSGQTINHVGGNVVLTKGINAGAEAITDYSLHVYGKAEGRLVAGATGDINAKIFCLRFNPSLVSVAGTYCLKENIPTEFLDKAVQVSYIEGQGLTFELMA